MTSKRKPPRLALSVLDVLSAPDADSVRAWAASKKLKTTEALAELVAFALTELRSRRRGDNVRPQLMGESAARTWAFDVAQLLKAKPLAAWLHVDYATAKVVAVEANPGGRKGHVYLDARPQTRDEWKDTAGRLTTESALARLLGAARPMGGS